VAVLVSFFIVSEPPTRYDNYTYLAEAFLHGRVSIDDWPGKRIDAQIYNGKAYIIEGPVPALLMLPAVAAFGMDADQRAHCIFFAAASMSLLWILLGRLGAHGAARFALLLFFLIGTSFYWCAMYGDVWFFAHIAATFFTFGALLELTGRRRAWMIALCGVLAAGSRFTFVAVLPVYAVYLYATLPPGRRVRSLAAFAAPVLAGAAAWSAYAYARWGVPYDIGYTLWYHDDIAGYPTGSPFRLVYLPYQISSFFGTRPMLWHAYPWIIPSPNSVSLTVTSPALLYAFWARRPLPLVAALWSAAVLIAIPSFLYYVNGFVQFGMRHALDFEPFLIALMALAAKERMPWWVMLLIGYSLIVGIWGLWFWRMFYRP
jgi:hypothetical protein